MELKKPIPLKEQLIKCKSDGLTTEDDSWALQILSEIGYYKLMGYAFQFVTGSSGHKYSATASFELVYKLYCFDSELRELLRKYLEILEVYYKALIANTFSMRVCTSPPYDQHYYESNYYHKEYFSAIKEAFEKENEYYKESAIVKHHKKKYGGKMPLWALLELLSFSNTSKLYASMYDNDQDAIASLVHVGRKTLANNLHCMSVLRNKCSHAARIYNTTLSPAVKLSDSILKRCPSLSTQKLFAFIIMLSKRLPNTEYRTDFKEDFTYLIAKYNGIIDHSLLGIPVEYENYL